MNTTLLLARLKEMAEGLRYTAVMSMLRAAMFPQASVEEAVTQTSFLIMLILLKSPFTAAESMAAVREELASARVAKTQP